MFPDEDCMDNGTEILVVEDSPTQAERLRYILERHGYEAAVAGNGRDALELVQKRKPAIIISDVLMPGMDGYEMCMRIKTDKDLKDIPVILLTALSDPKDVLRGLECGADNFITKPYGERSLISRIQYILANMKIRESKVTRMGIEISLKGETFTITSERQQILDLLLSTYEAAVDKNNELIKTQEELKKLNERLEEKVKDRTAALTNEISERRQAEDKVMRLNRLYSVLSQTNQTIIRLRDKKRLFEEICRIAVEQGRFRMAWVGLLDEETRLVVPAFHYGEEDGYLDNIKIFVGDRPEGRGPTGMAIREGRHFICGDIEKDPMMLPWREEALKRGYRSSASFPIDSAGRLVGCLNVYSAEPGFFDEAETLLLDELAADLSFALTSIEHEELRTMAEEALRIEASVSRALLDAARITSAHLNWDEAVDKILPLVHGLVDGKGAAVIMLSEDGALRPFKAAGLVEDVLHSFYNIRAGVDEITAFGEIRKTRKSRSLRASELCDAGLGCFTGPLGLKDFIITPIVARDKVVGFLTGNFERLPSDPRVLEIFQGIAGQLGVAYENSRLYEESIKRGLDLARKVEALKVLSEIDRMILSTLDKGEMLSRAVHQIRRIVPADVGGVFLLDPEVHALRYSYGWGLGLQKDDAVPLDGCSGSACLKSGKPQVRANIQEVSSLTYMDRKLADSGVCSDMYVPVISKGVGAGLLCLGSFRVAGFSLEDVHTAENLANQISIALENTKLFSDLEEMLINVVLALSSAIDAKSPWTKGHSERVTGYAVQIAKRMGFGEEEIDRLKLAGLLHDIGKIGTYDVILDKPDKLTAEEFEMVKRHPDRGCEILSPIKQFKDILPAIRHHHERWDGKGYPAGLKGEATPLMARILAVADSFDSMTADRPYRPSPGVEYAVSEFRRCKGTQFDPETVEVFLEIIAAEGVKDKQAA